VVRLATEKATGRKLAVKIIDKSNIDVSKESLKVEVTVMKKLDHPNAVKLVDLYESPRRVYLVLPL
jgi:serine/threonine protein kinase